MRFVLTFSRNFIASVIDSHLITLIKIIQQCLRFYFQFDVWEYEINSLFCRVQLKNIKAIVLSKENSSSHKSIATTVNRSNNSEFAENEEVYFSKWFFWKKIIATFLRIFVNISYNFLPLCSIFWNIQAIFVMFAVIMAAVANPGGGYGKRIHTPFDFEHEHLDLEFSVQNCKLFWIYAFLPKENNFCLHLKREDLKYFSIRTRKFLREWNFTEIIFDSEC